MSDISLNNNIVSSKNNSKPDIMFWGEDPNILVQSFEFFPVDSMSYNQNLNAITRLVIIITLLGFFVTYNYRLIIIGAITLAAIYILFVVQKKHKESRESFKNATTELLKKNPPSFAQTFDKPSSTNPFSNVLMPDYEFNPDKKPAPASYGNDDILDKAKKLVSELNPDQPDIADKLFRDLGEQLTFEQSLRPFYSTASTTIPNDQNAFAEFCYGSMISCKEGNPTACARNLARHTLV